MTLQEIVQRIQASQQLAEQDSLGALQKNRALFLDLIRQDQVFIVPEATVSPEALEQKLFRPYIAPAQDGDPRLFLRVFSHMDLATMFAEQNGQNQVCELDGVELVQLSKTYFLRGIYGLLLNDGSAWTAISFPDLLIDFYHEILGDDSLARPEFISLIQFINMVRQNYAYNIQVGRPTMYDAAVQIQVRFTDRPNDIWSPEAGEWLYEECKLDHLISAAGSSNETLIHIKTAKCDMRIQPAYLRAALCAAGLADRKTQPDLNFHTDSIALDYRMQDFDLERLPIQCELAELPKLDDGDRESEPQQKDDPVKKEPEHPILRYLMSLFNRPDKVTAEPKEEVLDIPSGEQKSEDKTVRQKEKKPFNIDTKIMVKGFFGVAFLLILIAVIMQLLKPSPIDELKKAVASGDNAEAVVLYDECIRRSPDTREELLQLFADDLQNSLSDYAADEISANQLADKINAYKGIAALQSKCDATYTQASALERSKTAFNKGLVETSMVARLTEWKAVIPEDTGSTAAMQKALESNAELYKDLLFEEIKEMDRGDALSGLMLLQSFYPDDKDVVERIQMWREQMVSQQVPDSVDDPPSSTNSEEEWPIIVGDIFVTYNGSGYDLHIPWQNKSGHSINGLLFTVTALDSEGNPVFSTTVGTDGQETTYSQYIADVGSGPYEDGFVWPENAYWANAWNTTQKIENVRLDGIWLSYADADIAPWTYSLPGSEAEQESKDEEAPSSWADLIGGLSA